MAVAHSKLAHNDHQYLAMQVSSSPYHPHKPTGGARYGNLAARLAAKKQRFCLEPHKRHRSKHHSTRNTSAAPTSVVRLRNAARTALPAAGPSSARSRGWPPGTGACAAGPHTAQPAATAAPRRAPGRARGASPVSHLGAGLNLGLSLALNPHPSFNTIRCEPGSGNRSSARRSPAAHAALPAPSLQLFHT